jgi:hypothetical protein
VLQLDRRRIVAFDDFEQAALAPDIVAFAFQVLALGPISDPAELSIVWRAALGVLVACTSMRPFISLSRSRKHDRLKGGAAVPCLVPSAVMR